MDYLKKIVKESSLVFGGQIYFMVANLILVMILTRLLTLEDFGTFTLAQTIINTLAVLGLLGLPRAIVRFTALYKAQEDWNKIKSIFNKLTRHIVIFGFMLCVVVFIFGQFYSEIFFNASGIGIVISILAFTYPFRFIVVSIISLFTGLRQMLYPSLFQYITQPTMRITLAFILLVLAQNQLIYWVYGLVFLFVIDFLLSVKIFKENIPESFKKSNHVNVSSREIYNFAVPIFLSTIVLIGTNNVDILMLGYFNVTKEVGIYKVYKIMTALIIGAISSLAVVYNPTLAELISKKDDVSIRLLYQRIAKWYQLIAFIGFIFILAVGQDLGKILFGINYSLENPLLVVILASGPLINGIAGPAGMTLESFGNTHFLMFNSVISFIAIIVANYFLIPVHGMIGASLSLMICYFVLYSLSTIELYLIKGMHPFSSVTILIMVLSILAIVILVVIKLFIIKGEQVIFRSFINLLIIVVYLISLFLFKVFDDEDKRIASIIYKKIFVRNYE